MDPASVEMPDGERRWLVEAFLATASSSMVTKIQPFGFGETHDRVMLVLGNAAEVAIIPGEEKTQAMKIFGSFVVERGTLQGLVNTLAQEHDIRAVTS